MPIDALPAYLPQPDDPGQCVQMSERELCAYEKARDEAKALGYVLTPLEWRGMRNG